MVLVNNKKQISLNNEQAEVKAHTEAVSMTKHQYFSVLVIFVDYHPATLFIATQTLLENDGLEKNNCRAAVVNMESI